MSWRAAVLLLACSACLIACPSGDDDDSSAGEDPTPEEPFDPSLYEVLEYDLTEKDGEAYKGVEDSETVFHVQRFRTDTPLRVVAIGAMFNVRGDDDSPAHLAIYPDEGHNFFDFLRETPLVEF